VRETLAEWHLDDLADAAMLLTSEIVTNSVLHARTVVTVRVERDGTSGVCISVTDESPVIPSMRLSSATATTGRGIHMLDQLAEEWHTFADGDGKTVTFRLSSGQGSSASAGGGGR
jgi:anti-sigma regulatory factor (Ser/Thr protein kinase)